MSIRFINDLVNPHLYRLIKFKFCHCCKRTIVLIDSAFSHWRHETKPKLIDHFCPHEPQNKSDEVIVFMKYVCKVFVNNSNMLDWGKRFPNSTRKRFVDDLNGCVLKKNTTEYLKFLFLKKLMKVFCFKKRVQSSAFE